MKLLFMRFSSLGDIMLTTGVINALYLKLKNENLKIDILTYEEFADIWEFFPYINKVYTVKRGISLNKYIKFLKEMPEYDHIFDLHNSIRTKTARCMLKGQKHAYEKNSLCRRLYVKFRLCKDKLKAHTVQKYAKAVFPVFKIDMPTLEELRPTLLLNKSSLKNKVVIHPFASKNTKIWNEFPALSEALSKEGMDIFVVGKGDFPVIKGIQRVHTESLYDLIEFMSDAELVITTDSGPMHIGVALNRKVLSIFCSTTRELGFYPDFENAHILEVKGLKCRPCHVHGYAKCPRGDFACGDIPFQEVLKEVWKILKP